MTQKEKLEEAKKLYKTANADQRYVLESLFPELAESEDERIRKTLIELVEDYKESSAYGGFGGLKWDKLIAWLEKQGKSVRVEAAMKEVEEKSRLFTEAHKGESADEILAEMRGQEKPAWSEEDEKIKENLQSELCNLAARRLIKESTCDKYYNWLKSLRPQNHWKPSDEQMKQLGWIAKQNKDNMIGKELMSLYQDLQKLKG